MNTVTAEKLLYGGDALARRDDGKAIFIPYAVPGDKLLIEISSEKKNYARAKILEVLMPGKWRVTPICPYFEKCGGCCWQHIEYSWQVEAKRLILEELFHHRFPEARRLEITMRPCPRPFGYRSRARVQMQVEAVSEPPLSFSRSHVLAKIRKDEIRKKTAVGFFRGSSHIVEDVENCLLFRPRLNDALRALRQIPFKSFSKNIQDSIHEIDIACSEDEGKWAKGGDGTLLQRKVGDFSYNISAESFFQANDFMIDSLVSHVLDCVSNTETGAALDLFSGVGLFSLPLSRRFSAVSAVEYSRESHELCEINAAEAGVDNLENNHTDTSKWFDSQPKSRFDCVVLDPPRVGVSTGVMERIDRLDCGTIVYISCDPHTLARDLERLDMDRWRIVSITGFDMFPQTYHFETVVHLTAIKNRNSSGKD